MLLAVLAVATSVIAVAGWSSWQRSAQDQASFATGADVRVELPPAAPLPLGQTSTVTSAPGVTGATPVVRSQIGLPNSGTAASCSPSTAATRPRSRRSGPTWPVGHRRHSLTGSRRPRHGGRWFPVKPSFLDFRLLITATMTPGVPGHPVLFVQLVDAFGVSYQVEAGAFTADGRPHPLTVPLAARRGAAYPLRITGFALQYVMPKRQSGLAHLVIGPVRAAAAMTGAAGESFAPGRPGEPLAKLVSTGDPTSQGRLVASPAIITVLAGPARLTINFDTGAGYGPPSRDCGQPHNLYPCGPPSTLPATLTVLAVSRPGSLPAVVTSNFAKAIGTGLGRSFPVSYAAAPRSISRS